MYRDMQKWIEQNRDHLNDPEVEHTVEKMKELDLAGGEANHELSLAADPVSNLVEVIHHYQ